MLASEEAGFDAASLRDLALRATKAHHPGHRVVDVQPGSVGKPPLVHAGGDEWDGQGSLPRRSGLVK